MASSRPRESGSVIDTQVTRCIQSVLSVRPSRYSDSTAARYLSVDVAACTCRLGVYTDGGMVMVDHIPDFVYSPERVAKYWTLDPNRDPFPPPAPKLPPVPPRVKAINAIVALIDEYGISSPYDAAPEAGITGTGSFIGISGDPGPMIYHTGTFDCPVLATDFYLANSYGGHVIGERMPLDVAKQRGIACLVCLLGVAKARNEHLRAKPCHLVGSDIDYPAALLLRWRKDPTGIWRGVVIYETEDTMICDVVASTDLRPTHR